MFQTEPLDPARHRRAEFCCESPELTDFLPKRARKEMEARSSAFLPFPFFCPEFIWQHPPQLGASLVKPVIHLPSDAFCSSKAGSVVR
jgi:hypothetical protein